ncbi:MAG: hypothetical protein JWP08_4259 [Bryobacterales bacterium]|nr:hypothetical protein [Bryobacterales bacterium]
MDSRAPWLSRRSSSSIEVDRVSCRKTVLQLSIDAEGLGSY